MDVVESPLRFDANLGWLFTESPFERRFEDAARAGFAGVEYPRPYDFSPAFLRKCLSDAGLHQVLINAPMGDQGTLTAYGTACHPADVAQFRRGFTIALEYAVALECDLIHVPGGIIPPTVGRDLAFSTYVTNIAWVAEQVADTPVRIALEAINRRDAPGFVLDSAEQAASVVQAVGSDRLGVLFDIYHCQASGGDLTTRLAQLLPVIAHIQIADVPGRREPGTGEIAWPFIFGQIQALGYAGWIGCEYQPSTNTTDSLKWRDGVGAASAAGRDTP